MKKKVVSVLLCAAMASTMLVGCGDKVPTMRMQTTTRTQAQTMRGMQTQARTMPATTNRLQAVRRFP